MEPEEEGEAKSKLADEGDKCDMKDTKKVERNANEGHRKARV